MAFLISVPGHPAVRFVTFLALFMLPHRARNWKLGTQQMGDMHSIDTKALLVKCHSLLRWMAPKTLMGLEYALNNLPFSVWTPGAAVKGYFLWPSRSKLVTFPDGFYLALWIILSLPMINLLVPRRARSGSQPQWGHVETEGLILEHMAYHSPAALTSGKTNPLPGMLIICFPLH